MDGALSWRQAEYILRLVKTCRKFNLALIMITQDVEDVLVSRAGRAVLTNTATKILLKQDTSVLDQIVERFHLNEAETRFLKMSTMGRALLIAETMRVPIYITASPEEHKIITTRPDELVGRIEIKHPEGVELLREFNINNPIHKKSDLTDEQLQALAQRNFEELRVKTLTGESELFLIRNETDQTDEHFILQNITLDEIRRYTDRGLLHHTRLPDITFETNSGKMVAVEVEADVGVRRSIDNMTEKLPMMQKYDDYFFVVANPALKRDYGSKFGDVLTREEVPARIASYFK